MTTPSDPSRATPTPHRPGLLLLIKYSYGGSLPSRYNAWVLHDVTCRTWALRHFMRWTLLVTAPLLAIYLVFVPGSLQLRVLTGLTFAGALLLLSFVNIVVDTDKRAVRAGYSYSEPSRIRGQRSAEAHRRAAAARRERIGERQAQRRLDRRPPA